MNGLVSNANTIAYSDKPNTGLTPQVKRVIKQLNNPYGNQIDQNVLNGLYNFDFNRHGTITNYNPSLKERVMTYWHFTPPEEKFIDTISNGLSLVAGMGPALKGLALAKHAAKYVPNATKNFVTNLAKGLAKEGAENVIADKVDSEMLNHALAVEDAYQVAKLLRKF